MGKHFFLLFCLCFLASTRSYASISPEDYWKFKLPTTPMPQAIKASLAPAAGGGINGPPSTSLASINGYIGLLSYDNKSPVQNSLASTNGYDGLLSYDNKSPVRNSLASTNGYDGLLSYDNKSPVQNSLASTNGYDGLLSYDNKSPVQNSLASTNGYDGLLSYDNKSPVQNSLASTNGYDNKTPVKNSLASTNGYDGLLSYDKASAKDSLASVNQYVGSYKKAPQTSEGNSQTQSKKDNEDLNPDTEVPASIKDRVFFMEQTLQVGNKMDLVFKKGTKQSLYFLPREVSNKIPFSSDKLQEIYKILALDPESHEAYVLSRRIELCEEATVEGVEKQCVTSLESMVDFVINKMGTNVKALSTEVEKDHPKMEYTIHGVKRIAKNDHQTVVCHKMGYPYALFFCHRTATIRSYMVSLVGSDGTKIKAVAACHKETNEFLRNYMINILKVTPGSARVCHFPGADDNIMWVVAN